MRIIQWSVVLFTVLFTLSSCGLFKKSVEEAPPEHESFDDFYYRFHSDPDFQLSRIDFPLEGELVDGSGSQNWTEKNWEIMKVPIYEIEGSEYEVEYHRSDNEFYQKVWLENSGFVSEYRFQRIDGLWYLVFAYEQNL